MNKFSIPQLQLFYETRVKRYCATILSKFENELSNRKKETKNTTLLVAGTRKRKQKDDDCTNFEN